MILCFALQVRVLQVDVLNLRQIAVELPPGILATFSGRLLL